MNTIHSIDKIVEPLCSRHLGTNQIVLVRGIAGWGGGVGM